MVHVTNEEDQTQIDCGKLLNSHLLSEKPGDATIYLSYHMPISHIERKVQVIVRFLRDKPKEYITIEFLKSMLYHYCKKPEQESEGDERGSSEIDIPDKSEQFETYSNQISSNPTDEFDIFSMETLDWMESLNSKTNQLPLQYSENWFQTRLPFNFTLLSHLLLCSTRHFSRFD